MMCCGVLDVYDLGSQMVLCDARKDLHFNVRNMIRSEVCDHILVTMSCQGCLIETITVLLHTLHNCLSCVLKSLWCFTLQDPSATGGHTLHNDCQGGISEFVSSPNYVAKSQKTCENRHFQSGRPQEGFFVVQKKVGDWKIWQKLWRENSALHECSYRCSSRYSY